MESSDAKRFESWDSTVTDWIFVIMKNKASTVILRKTHYHLIEFIIKWKLRFHYTLWRELSTTRQALLLYKSIHTLVKQNKTTTWQKGGPPLLNQRGRTANCFIVSYSLNISLSFEMFLFSTTWQHLTEIFNRFVIGNTNYVYFFFSRKLSTSVV